ncbi:PREDICTED: cilia- and flagella-associated protein 97-like [Vollenhovia emeryi]|uniref:cilia- and flagella-associated protein 97-like n=1 Tax=Vollenhovia emeryi TaxID=411798 RepID=UPI0005F49919|nr:PREDICTED: cilia- and flagella-associated protein 97-like [Vollenhovia emeryi]
MANQGETNTICECRYASDEDTQGMKESFNNAFNIHEIDEEESETEETNLEGPNSSASDEEDEVVQKTKDDESVYTGESFCSDESCDDSEVTNVTSRSLNSSSLIHVTDLQLSQSLEEQDISESRWKDDRQDETCSLSDASEPPRAATADRDRFAKSRRCRRWNMSFTDEEMRKIERENELLLRKIMAQQKPRHKIPGEETVQSRTSSSAINRRKLQKKIENDNALLLRRIQQAKSCVFTSTSRMGCRLTFL